MRFLQDTLEVIELGDTRFGVSRTQVLPSEYDNVFSENRQRDIR